MLAMVGMDKRNHFLHCGLKSWSRFCVLKRYEMSSQMRDFADVSATF